MQMRAWISHAKRVGITRDVHFRYECDGWNVFTELWIPFDDILTKVPPPTPIGKSERFFEVPAETLSLIKNLKLSL